MQNQTPKTTRHLLDPARFTLCLILQLAMACASSANQSPEAPTSLPSGTEDMPQDASQPSSRPQLTAQDCEAKGGTVVGDIGDGAIHRPDYKCPSGMAPIGSIAGSPGEPIAVEGSVCCPE